MGKCQAIAAATGQQCRARALRGEEFCMYHSEQTRPKNIIDAIRDKRVFGRFFGDLETWQAWMTFFRVVYGLELDEADLELFKACTGRTLKPEGPFNELHLCVGRRGGKSVACSTLACFEALYGGHERTISPGESFFIFIVAPTRTQGEIVFNHVHRLLGQFQKLIVRERHDEITLTNGGIVKIMTADDKSIRGFSNLACVILDEAEYFLQDNVDSLMLALSPALLPAGKLITISSRNGNHSYLQGLRDANWAREGAERLIWMSHTLTMNPTYPAKKVADEIERNPLAKREFDPFAVVEDDALFDEKVIKEIAVGQPQSYNPKQRYVAFIDSSSGLHDACVLAIVSPLDDTVQVPVLMAADPPFDFVQVIDQFAETIKNFHCTEVYADRYAFGQLESFLRRHQIPLKMSRASASECYFFLRGIIDQNGIILPNDQRLIQELVRLETKRTNTGKVVEHPKNFTDDRAAALAAALYHWGREPVRRPTAGVVVSRNPHPIPEQEAVLHNREEIEDNEFIFQQWLQSTEEGVCLPFKAGREPELIEVKAKRKIGRHLERQPH